MKINDVMLAGLMALVVIIGAPSVCQAQSRLGIRGGLNASNISYDKLPNKSERLGFHVGIFTDVPLANDFMSLQPELSYSVKGASFKPITKKQSLNMNYVDLLLPVVFKLGIIDVQVGPFMSYLASKPDYTVYNENKVVIDAFKKFDAGLTGGLGFNFNKILLGIRYNQGFIDVTKDNSRPFLGSGNNSVGQISVGFRL